MMDQNVSLTSGSLEKLSKHAGSICRILESVASVRGALDDAADNGAPANLAEIVAGEAESAAYAWDRALMNDIYPIFKELDNRRHGA